MTSGFAPPARAVPSAALALLPKRCEQEQDVRYAYCAVSVDVCVCAVRCTAEVREQKQDIRHFDRAVTVDVFGATQRVAVAVEAVSGELTCGRVGSIWVEIAGYFILAACDFVRIAHAVVIAVAVDHAAGSVVAPLQ